MTLIYEYQGKKQAIEKIIQNHPVIEEAWNESIKEEYKYFQHETITKLIIDASEIFEEIMIDKDEEMPIYIGKDSKAFDLNVLLNALR